MLPILHCISAATRWKPRGRRDPSRGDEGFSVVELLASLTILSIGIVSLMGTLIVAARAAGTQRGRLNANFAANMAFEDIRSRPYAEIRLCTCDPNFALRPQTETTTDTVVTTDSTQPYVPVVREPIVLQNVRYEIVQNIAWVGFVESELGQEVSFYPKAYKLVVIRVTWRDHVGRHTIQMEGYVYPGGQGEQRERTQACQLASMAPRQPVTATAEVLEPLTPTIRITWRDRSPIECNYQVQYLQSDFPRNCATSMPFEWIMAAPALPQDREVFDFAAVHNTGFCFRVRAVNRNSPSPDDPTAEWTYTTWLATPPPPPNPDCLIQGPVVRSPALQNATPYRVKIQAGQGWNTDDIAFAISVSGNCTRVWAEVRNSSGQWVQTPDFQPFGGLWGAVVGPNWQRFNLGYGMVNFYAQGQGNPSPAQQTVCFYKQGGGNTC
jgi:hypothetical protein